MYRYTYIYIYLYIHIYIYIYIWRRLILGGTGELGQADYLHSQKLSPKGVLKTGSVCCCVVVFLFVHMLGCSFAFSTI